MKTILIIILFSVAYFSCTKTNEPGTSPSPAPTPQLPKLVTNAPTDLTVFSVLLSGRLVDTGSSKLTEWGIVVDTLPMPTTGRNLNKFIRPAISNGNFSVNIIAIPSNKNWYVRAYGINAQGTGYGEEIRFSSLPEKVYFGNVTLSSQQDVITFGANNYTTIRGSLYIDGPVNDLSPLSSLAIVGNGFEVKNSNLQNFLGLEKLEIVGIDFIHMFRIENNPLLRNFSGMKSLKMVNGDFYIINNDALQNFTGLEKFVTSANFEFRIASCDALTSFTGLENMQSILGRVMIIDNPLLSDISAWSNLSTIKERLSFVNNASLQKLDGLEKLTRLEGIELVNNPMLTDINGLRNLDTITEFINIDNNDALTNLTAFNKINKLQYLLISNNALISNLEGFKNLQLLQHTLHIENNSSLSNLQGLRRLKEMGKLEVYSNSSLLNLAGLDSLTTINNDVISINIAFNNQIQSLDGLQKAVNVYGSIQIFTNPALVNYCGLKPLFLAGYSQYFSAQNNGANPTQTQIISSCP